VRCTEALSLDPRTSRLPSRSWMRYGASITSPRATPSTDASAIFRTKLQNDWRRPRFIATEAGRGYRFVPVFSEEADSS